MPPVVAPVAPNDPATMPDGAAGRAAPGLAGMVDGCAELRCGVLLAAVPVPCFSLTYAAARTCASCRAFCSAARSLSATSPHRGNSSLSVSHNIPFSHSIGHLTLDDSVLVSIRYTWLSGIHTCPVLLGVAVRRLAAAVCEKQPGASCLPSCPTPACSVY
jgi:hypothetical protein